MKNLRFAQNNHKNICKNIKHIYILSHCGKRKEYHLFISDTLCKL